MKYLLIDEDHNIEAKEDIDESELSGCNYPSVVRISSVDGDIFIEHLNYMDIWKPCQA